MCCAFLALVLAGPRIFGVFWWLFQPVRWNVAFAEWFGFWWIWPAVGLIFLPWTTLMFVLVSPLGIVGWDWLWLALTLAVDLGSYAGGAGRQRIPGYEGY